MLFTEFDTVNRIHDYYVIATLERNNFERDIMWTQLSRLIDVDQQIFIIEELARLED
jgi:hypothetical protein